METGGKKNKMPKDRPEVPDDLTEEEMKYYYRNPEGYPIFTPIYEIYNEVYMQGVVSGTSIKTAYGAFTDTAWMEKYTANVYQFSAAKTVDTARKMQALVYTPEGVLKPWNKFRDDADEIAQTANKNWLRVERDNAARQAIMADKWDSMRQDADIAPYWMYVGRMDSRERPEHVALEGLIFRIGDPYGDRMFPPSDWNCRCTGKSIDARYVEQKRRVVQTNDQAKGWLEGTDPKDGKPFVNPQFRYNPADQGMMPKVGDYFIKMPNANVGNANLFGLQGPGKPELHATMIDNLPELMREWRDKYHSDRLGNVTFQNYALLSNVMFTRHAANQMHAHPRGAAMLPETIANPSEVWMRWEDVAKQQVVLRNYITYIGSAAYVVQTRDGAIQDAFLQSRGQTERHRIGLPYIA